jgi:hypothetical protein
MKINIRKYFVGSILLVLISFFCISCDETDPNPDPVVKENEAKKVMTQLWSTSSLNFEIKREDAFNKIQSYADKCSAAYFKTYLNSTDAQCENLEKYDLTLFAYRAAFDKVLEEVKTTQVKNGTTVIWMLYNMGYVIKTPSACFGVDISHRWAVKLAPYLDFVCITHNHSDHYSKPLYDEMFKLNKPVLSNYLRSGQNYQYTTTTSTSFKIGKIGIFTNMNDHNATLKNFVTTYQFNCGEDGGNLVIMHIGDSNFTPSQYNIKEPVDIFIPRYAPNSTANSIIENNIIGQKVKPKYVLLSHILELAHEGVEESRWSIQLGLERASKLDCGNSILPFWGEKLVWENGKLNF